MSGKAADDPGKTTVNPLKTTLNSRISGRCYKSFRQNGAAFWHNSVAGMSMELPLPVVEFKCRPANDLQPIAAVGRKAELRNGLFDNDFHRAHPFSTPGHVCTTYNDARALI